MRSSILFAVLATFISTANAHGTMTKITGANGVTGQGIGIVADTPRDGSTPVPFEQDTSVIRDREIASGKTGVCGRTAAGGNNDVAASVASDSAVGLPSMAADGTLTMTIHQVNQDGGGPYACEISTDASGTDFQPMTVTTNVAGIRGFSAAAAQDFPLVAQAPAGTNCTGGPNGDACLVRCRNNTPAGPFGSCATVTGSVDADAAPKTAAKQGLGGLLGGAGGAGGAGKGKGLLKGLLGRDFTSEQENKKRVVGSRIIQRGLAGRWI